MSIGDVTVEVEGPVDEAETWFESLREDYLDDIDREAVEAAANGSGSTTENPDAPQTDAPDAGPTTSGKSRSLTEFYRSTDNPTKRDAALIVGWYLEYHEEQTDFTKPEIEEKAKDSKIGLGANVSRDLSKQVEEGHLEKVDERDGQDAYHLTLTGEEYVQEELIDQ